jgi:hypothetical protein
VLIALGISMIAAVFYTTRVSRPANSVNDVDASFTGRLVVYFRNVPFSRMEEIISSVRGSISSKQEPLVLVVTFRPPFSLDDAIAVIKVLETFPEVRFATPYLVGGSAN